MTDFNQEQYLSTVRNRQQVSGYPLIK